MSSLEAVLFARLTGDAGVFALVGTRVYPVNAPPGAALPHLVYSRAGGAGVRAMGGATGIQPARVQVSVKARGFDQGVDVCDAVKAALVDWFDDQSSPVVMDSALEAEFDGFDDRRTPDGGGHGGFRRNLDFMITYRS
jgi:hypothetical protein